MATKMSPGRLEDVERWPIWLLKIPVSLYHQQVIFSYEVLLYTKEEETIVCPFV
jgi:hypothetical protein